MDTQLQEEGVEGTALKEGLWFAAGLEAGAPWHSEEELAQLLSGWRSGE